VAILEADKEGVLRSERSLIQTSGRAARNVGGQVIMYADTMTRSITACLKETGRRRTLQDAYNREHSITPESIKKSIDNILASIYEADYASVTVAAEEKAAYLSDADLEKTIRRLKAEMKEAAGRLEFEKAASLRDQIKGLTELKLELGGKS